MKSFYDFSIRSKLILSVVTLLILALVAFSSFSLLLFYQHTKADLFKQSQLQSNLIAEYSVTPLMFDDRIGAKEILSKLESIPNVNRAVLYDDTGHEFSAYEKSKLEDSSPSNDGVSINSNLFFESEIVISAPVLYNKQVYGAVMMHISTQEISEEIAHYLIVLFFSSVVLIVFSLFIINKIQRYITLPIISLAKITKEISLSENYTIRAQKVYMDEVGNLYDDFNTMLAQLEIRGRERDEAEEASRTYQTHLEHLTDELEDRVEKRTLELQESLDNLQKTQSQLVESEKMSALGNLVAGVAHEVNTPLGISITAASVFKNEIAALKKSLKDNELSKSGLEHFIETVEEADDILVKNLDRAAKLVKNFKKISVDQSSEEIRDFGLNNYLEEVLSTFKNELKHRPVTLKLDLCPDEIEMHSYPGAISQIIVNLLQNALLHGFDYDQEGDLIIETKQKDGKAVIVFSDNGKGVDEAIESKIFEPFITTKRNSGGTGLGLNITYNLVTQQLNGTIKLDHKNRKGARFIIEIPCKIGSK